MARNKLKLNRNKTELLVIGSKHRPCAVLDSILVSDCCVCPSKTARNIGAVFLSNFQSLDKHANLVCKSALFHSRKFVSIREYLTVESTKALVHAFVTCRLDNCQLAAHQITKVHIHQASGFKRTI